MKIKLTISFIFSLVVSSQIVCQKNKVIDHEKIYSFLNSTISTDTIRFNLSAKTDFGMFDERISEYFNDSFFNPEDSVFLLKQFQKSQYLKWQKGKINGAKIISKRHIKLIFRSDNGWLKFRKQYGDCLTNFSLPIFTKNDEYCIFYYWTQCDYLAGGGRLNLYQFKDGKWIFIKTYISGVS
jgi:hypothetical protein